MIPLMRIDDRRIRIGPYVVHPDIRRVETSGWMDWTDEMFPQPLSCLMKPAWLPSAYSGRAGGGVWAVETPGHAGGRYGGARVIMLSGDGRPDGFVDIPESLFNVRTPLLVSGDWLLAFGNFIRGGKIIGGVRRDDEEAVLNLLLNRACLGPDGELVLPDGRAIRPDGSEIRAFEPADLIAAAAGVSGPAPGSRLEAEISVLSWDGHHLTALVIPQSLHGSRGWRSWIVRSVPCRRPAGRGKARVEVLRVVEGDRRPQVHHLNDGGWVVEVPRSAGPGHRDEVEALRVIFQLPGRCGILEHDIPPGRGYVKLSGILFVADSTGGLLAMLEGKTRSGERRILLREMGEGMARTVPVFPVSSDEFLKIFMDSWMIVGGRRRPAIVFGCRCPGWPLPGKSFSVSDIEEALSARGDLISPIVRGIAKHGDLILAYGDTSRPGMFFTASFRLSHRGLRIIDVKSILTGTAGAWAVADVRPADAGDLLIVLLFIQSSSTPMPVAVQMASDGSLAHSRIS